MRHQMIRRILGAALFFTAPGGLMLASLTALISCGGGDEEDSDRHDHLIEIFRPAPVYASTVVIFGDRWSSVRAVNWSTASGAGGAAKLTSRCTLIGFGLFHCTYGWTASIPLIVGANAISVTGHDEDGNADQDSITVWRLPCPSPPPPESCS